MTKTRGTRRQLTDHEKSMEGVWGEIKDALGPGVPLLVDTCAILASFVEHDDVFKNFMEREASGFRLFTSTFVVGEATRRLTKPRSKDPFAGPNGITDVELAVHVIQNWLASNKIQVLGISDRVYEEAKSQFVRFKYLPGWDIVDATSFVLLSGLAGPGGFIATGDKAFRQVGMQLAPSDAFERYTNSRYYRHFGPGFYD